MMFYQRTPILLYPSILILIMNTSQITPYFTATNQWSHPDYLYLSTQIYQLILLITIIIRQYMLEDIKIKLVTCGSHQFGIFDQIIGEGGSAVVKKGYNKNHPKQLYAVKIVGIKDQDNKELALKELEIMQQLPVHPNLVRIEKIKVESQNNIYIFMEFCNGGTLFDLANKRNLAEDEIYDLFCQLMKGYKVLYDHKIIHEDIKLENILIHDGIYKISDFGLAITSENYKYGIKRKGTLSYMPYEKLTKKDYVANSKCDIYSFGIVMYELICRRHPYIAHKMGATSWIKEFREAELKNDLLGRYSLRFRPFFDVVLRMVAKLEGNRINFEELWKFYESSELLAPHRAEKQKGSTIVPQVPQKYSVIATSHASIISFSPEQSPQILQMRNTIEQNKKIAQLIEIIIKSIKAFNKTGEEKQCEQLEFILHLSRSQIMKSFTIDWFSVPETFKEEIENYESDCRFVQQELMDYLSQTSIAQESKKRMSHIKSLPTTQEILSYVKKVIMSLFKSRFMIVRINFSKEIQLLYYLISFVKALDQKQIDVARFEAIQREGEQDYRIKPEIEEFLKNQNVMIDGDEYCEKELSEEFQLLQLE